MTTAEPIREAKKPSEKEFQAQVVALAKLCKWSVYHTFDSRKSDPGFPDLVLCKAGRAVLFVELKTETGKVSAEQQAWYERLYLSGADVRLWRPSNWPTIEATLKGEA